MLQRTQQQAYIDKLAWPQRVIFVLKGRLQADCSCALIDLVVDESQRAFPEQLMISAPFRNDLERSVGHFPRDVRKLPVRQAKHRRDRLELGDHHQSVRIPGMDNVALVDKADAGPPRKGRCDRAVGELRLRALDGGLIALNRCLELANQRALRVHALLRGKVMQVDKTLQIAPGVLELRFVFCLYSFRLIQCGLKWSRIDLGQQIAGLDVLSLGERYLVELTIHPDLYHYGVEGLDGP